VDDEPLATPVACVVNISLLAAPELDTVKAELFVGINPEPEAATVYGTANVAWEIGS
jgi:hypothetical protein